MPPLRADRRKAGPGAADFEYEDLTHSSMEQSLNRLSELAFAVSRLKVQLIHDHNAPIPPERQRSE